MKIKDFAIQVENRRQTLQKNIDDLLNAFVEETGLNVEGVNVRRVDLTTVSSKQNTFVISTHVEISLP